MEKIRQDTSPNALRGIEICESRETITHMFFNNLLFLEGISGAVMILIF
jgi:hypothetical protein